MIVCNFKSKQYIYFQLQPLSEYYSFHAKITDKVKVKDVS